MGRKPIEMIRKHELDEALATINSLRLTNRYLSSDVNETRNKNSTLHTLNSDLEQKINNLTEILSVSGKEIVNQKSNVNRLFEEFGDLERSKRNEEYSQVQGSSKIEDNIFKEPSISSRGILVNKPVSSTRKTRQTKTKTKQTKRRK